MKLYFGNMVTTVTTLMILSLVGFVGYSISNRGDINFWGRRSLFVLAYGLIICCFAAARDGLDKTIQYMIDGHQLQSHSICVRYGFMSKWRAVKTASITYVEIRVQYV